MRHARAYALAGFAALVAGAVAFAQTTVTPLPENPPVEALPLEAVSAVADLAKAKPGDAQAGATKAATCAACHGLDGNSTDPTLYPRIAGQSERYIARQLALFKSGERANAIMQPYASVLSPQDMRDLGAHFATRKPGAGIADDGVIKEGPYQDMKYYEVGQKLFRGGDRERGIPACMACHGPAGQGNPGPAYPRVAGQQSWYTTRRLQEFRAGTTPERERALFDVMAAVAKSLTDEEIGALSSYLQGLHPRPDAATLAAMAKMPKQPAPAAAAPAAQPAPAPAPPTPAPAAPANDAQAPAPQPAPTPAPPAQGS